MNIIGNKKIPFALSSILFLGSVVLLFTLGLKPGIDFTGGSLLEVSFVDDRPNIAAVQEALTPLDLGEVQAQPTGDKGMILKTRYISEAEHQAMLSQLRDTFPRTEGVDEETAPVDTSDTTSTPVDVQVLNADGAPVELTLGDAEASAPNVIEERIETIGPSISANLKERAWEIGLTVIIAIIVYIAYAFRKVSKPVSSWKFGVIAIVALIHDVTIVIGLFALLGHFYGVEVNIPFVVALLTILGYSVNDTIVVFDRIRENLIRMGYQKFDEVVNKGVNDTLLRSLNTSFTTLLVLLALFFFGGESIKYFALALIAGVVVGTYSSIFLASPLLVVWEQWKKK